MGFLRKVGRKIKKGIKELFSSKIGSIVGSIAISMILGPVIGKAFNGVKTALGFGQKQITQQVAEQVVQKGLTEAATQQAGEELITQNLAQQAAQQEAGKAITSESLNKVLETSVTPIEKAANLSSKFAEGTLNGDIPFKINTSVTGALNDVNTYLETGNMFTPEQTKLIQQTSASAAELNKPTGFKKLVKGFEKFREAPIQTTKEFIGEDFVPDVAKSLVTSTALSALQGEPEDIGGYGRMPQVGAMEAPISSYVQDVGTQYMAATSSTRMPSFQELSQQTLFGNGTPQYLMQMYQPLGAV